MNVEATQNSKNHEILLPYFEIQVAAIRKYLYDSFEAEYEMSASDEELVKGFIEALSIHMVLGLDNQKIFEPTPAAPAAPAASAISGKTKQYIPEEAEDEDMDKEEEDEEDEDMDKEVNSKQYRKGSKGRKNRSAATGVQKPPIVQKRQKQTEKSKLEQELLRVGLQKVVPT